MTATDIEPSDDVPESVAAELEGSSDEQLRAIIHYAHKLLWEHPPLTEALEARDGEEIVSTEDHGAYTTVIVEPVDASGPDQSQYAYRVQWESGIDGEDDEYRWHYLGKIGAGDD